MINNTSKGIVEAEFDKKSKKTHCGVENQKTEGEWKGVEKIKATATGVEAIKVE